MAPTLLGPTLLATCTTCQYAFPIAAETYRSTLPARCSNCGGLCRVDPAIHPGQTVLLEPLAGPNDVRRWDVIAFRDLASGTTQVKRVWGLPGESIELRQGEAWSDGVMLRKSLAELRQVAVPVYDLLHGGGCQWWCSEGEGRRVRVFPAAAEAVARARGRRLGQPLYITAARALHMRAGLRYHLQHVRPAAVHPSDVPADQWLQPGPVIDVYTINQGLSTVDHRIGDGLIRLQLQRPLAGTLRIGVRVEVHGGERILEVLIHPAETSVGSTAESKFPADVAPTAADFRIAARQLIELGWCDGRLLLETDLQSRVVDAEQLAALPAATHGSHPQWESPEICRLTASHAIDISHFGFARDLYLTSATDIAAGQSDPAIDSIAGYSDSTAERRAGYYVLGDNVAASRDSRQELGRIPPAQVLGRIVASPAP